MIHELKKDITDYLVTKLEHTYEKSCHVLIEEPKDSHLGDLSIPLFQVGRELGINLPLLAEEVTTRLNSSPFAPLLVDIQMTKGFLNIHLNKQEMIDLILKSRIAPQPSVPDVKKTIVIDYSSPNIAKPFSIGHLRSTIIGHAIANIYQKLGHDVVRINHLGDWGTQFGKLIVAYQKWGNEQLIKTDPINELLKLYVKFHEEAEHNPDLENQGRAAFAMLEQGHEDYLALWKWFKEESLKDFMVMYELLGVSFDAYQGEAFYNDKMTAIIKKLEDAELLEFDQGAHIVPLGKALPPALIKKTDGSSLYITRDLAAIFYRKETYDFDEMVYVVGGEQTVHFKQLQAVTEKMGVNFHKHIHHVNFGLVLTDGKKMATRKGKIIKLQDVMNQAIDCASQIINEKNPNRQTNDVIAKKVGISAIIYNDLKNDRTKDIEFNIEQMLTFEGQTGVYLQYTSVRIQSILQKTAFDMENINTKCLDAPLYFDFLKRLDQFEVILQKAAEQFEPSVVAKYCYQVAKHFNKLYATEKFLVEDEIERNTKLTVLTCTKEVLDSCMQLLGMEVLVEM